MIGKSIKITFKIQGKTFSHNFKILSKLTQLIRATTNTTIPPFSEKAITGQVTCLHTVENVNSVTDNQD